MRELTHDLSVFVSAPIRNRAEPHGLKDRCLHLFAIGAFFCCGGGTRTPMSEEPDLQSGEPTNCSTPQYKTKKPESFESGF